MSQPVTFPLVEGEETLSLMPGNIVAVIAHPEGTSTICTRGNHEFCVRATAEDIWAAVGAAG